MTYQEKTLTCRDCGQQFVFLPGEQEFHAKKGFASEPDRCPQCRGGRKSGSKGKSSKNNGHGDHAETFPAVCAQCGKDTRLSFQPPGDRPVYCPNCLDQEQGSSSGYRRRSRGPSS